jgi:hypothetical protein
VYAKSEGKEKEFEAELSEDRLSIRHKLEVEEI